jgi:hypothetical protein
MCEALGSIPTTPNKLLRWFIVAHVPLLTVAFPGWPASALSDKWGSVLKRGDKEGKLSPEMYSDHASALTVSVQHILPSPWLYSRLQLFILSSHTEVSSLEWHP